MKKTYMKPLAEVLNVQMAQMIAASTELNIVDDVLDPEKDAESRMFEDLFFFGK